jgi:hypothetical protein
MSDDLNKKGSQDRSRINMNEPHEVSYWTTKFGITKEELKATVEKAGTTVVAVEKALRNK